MGTCYSCGFGGNNQKTNITPNLNSGISENTSNTTTTTTTNSATSTSTSTWSSNAERASEEAGQKHMLPHPSLKIFTFNELKAATRNFKSDMILGEGGFGKVYKGALDDKSFVAIKKLSSESLQGIEEWQTEVKFLGRLSHKNFVKLLGYCYEGTELLLVYEYMQKGSLENHLFGRGGGSILPWDVRVKILIGAAQGMAFLHSSDKQVIYRDFKTSNILLDGSYNAKISDFGLAKMGPEPNKSHITTRVMGTYGYVAPEYVNSGHLYVNSDVYGFGVVLVEMLTGMRAVDDRRPPAKHNLVEWAKPMLGEGRKLKTIMDPRLLGKYSSKAAFKIAQLALTCLEPEPKCRPSMDQVAETLQRLDVFLNVPHSPYQHHSPQLTLAG